ALGRLQRLDLESQPPGRFFLSSALALQLLHLVPVPQQLEMLPGREQQDGDEESGDADRLPQLALLLLVDFPDDGIVANVLLDRVLERLHQDILSAARSFALRARGFRPTSSSRGTSGFFVSTCTSPSRCCSARIVCLTMRSSSEWKVITT